jgi:hypothetical protein
MAGGDGLFDSAWLKWRRAIDHAQILQQDIDAAVSGGTLDPVVSVRTEYFPRRHGFGVHAIEVLGVPDQWGLVVGDVATNYRCAPDHLAWALVSRGRTPPRVLNDEQQSGVGFPIAPTRGGSTDLSRDASPASTAPMLPRCADNSRITTRGGHPATTS